MTKDNDLHKAVILEYFNNGFNQTRAVLAIKPELKYQQAARLGHLILNKKENRPLIKELQHELRESATITPAMVAQELKNIALVNITDVIGHNETEIKGINPSTQRAIKKVSFREKHYLNKDGSEATEKTVLYEMHDKIKALDMLSKYIGFYEAHNKQKAVNINLNKLDVHSLNNVLNLITGHDEPNTIDIPHEAISPQQIEPKEAPPTTPQGPEAENAVNPSP